ncbi:alanyl (membrane) aminopeptidase-like b [Pagrus major]|uniref:alanyl (membrane) aminopeptidase-like b n=1 Tax=Pagrus major TaxID=143350 RepID=UPI003CC8D03D
MPKETITSKAIAITFVVLTISAIAGIVTLTILFKEQTRGLNMTAPPTWTPTTAGPPPVMRLPKNLIPDKYEISIQPFLHIQIPEGINGSINNQSLIFTGQSTVYFHCVQPTTTVYLQSKNLEVSGGLLMNTKTREMIKVLKIIPHNDQSDFLEMPLDKSLEVEGNYSLSLSFSGEISENLEALFVSTYVEGNPAAGGDTERQRFLAATNLEPTSARRVFPCFDEPDMKAVFYVTIVHRKGATVLGNEAKKSSVDVDDEWEMTEFFPTRKMSTYLFAFTVSDFTSIDSKYNNVEIKTYARPEATAAGDTVYAANVTASILGFYDETFGIGYQQKTLDQIALPDLEVSAMENWGLITYQEGNLLFENEVSSLLHKEQIVTIIAHELAHQWFGNLVTMKWWNDVWLNEGFATYMSFLAADRVEPTFKIKELSIIFNLHAAFEHDSLVSSHPLSPPAGDVTTTLEIIQMFDTITYCKGAAVLRMLAYMVGETTFNTGIKRYLSDFMFQNTEPSDLWRHIQKAVDDDNGHTKVAEVMDSWTKQIGYPVVTINTNDGQITQKHFLFNDSSESNLMWQVPISYMTNISKPANYLLETTTVQTDDFVSKDGEWFLANIDCTGYYRVNYNLENWARLLTQLETNRSRIPLMNRGQLIDDAFNLARAKLVDVILALNSTRFLRNETEYIPWESAVRNLEYFVLMFDRSEVYGPMQVYLQRQIENLYNIYSYKMNNTIYPEVPKDPTSQRNQVNAIWYACSNGLPDCVAMASNMYAAWMDDRNDKNDKNSTNSTNPFTIDPNLRSVIYCQAVAAGGKEEWEFAWEIYQTTSDISEKDQLREALSCTKKIWLLNRYLEYTLDPEKIRLMDVASTIAHIARNEAGQALAWNFIRAHWDYVSQDGASFLINAVTERFSRQFELEELERFRTAYDVGPAARAVDQAIEQTRVNIEWVREHKDIVLQWFEQEISS